MTAIDRAFTKAFMLRDLASSGAAADSPGPLPPVDLRPEPTPTRAPDVPADPPVSEAHEAEAELDTEVRIEVQAEMQAEVETPVDSSPSESEEVHALADAALPDVEPPEETWVEPEQMVLEPDQTPAESVDNTPRGADALNDFPMPTPPEVDSLTSEDTPTAPDGPVFLSSFQVDSFAWPSGATRLSMVASDQVDQLADALTAGLEQGQQVVAVSGCRRGEGCTTLLLSVARRLAERELKIAMVDADLDNPLLARRLGLLPELGWEEVLTGRMTVGEVTIESIQDRLAVVPLCGSLAREDRAAGDRREPVAGLDVLREHYDLVLVDLGEFRGESAADSEGFDAVVDWIDAVVLVQDVRYTTQAELNRTRWRMEAAGLVEAGVTENFVDMRQSA